VKSKQQRIPGLADGGGVIVGWGGEVRRPRCRLIGAPSLIVHCPQDPLGALWNGSHGIPCALPVCKVCQVVSRLTRASATARRSFSPVVLAGFILERPSL